MPRIPVRRKTVERLRVISAVIGIVSFTLGLVQISAPTELGMSAITLHWVGIAAATLGFASTFLPPAIRYNTEDKKS